MSRSGGFYVSVVSSLELWRVRVETSDGQAKADSPVVGSGNFDTLNRPGFPRDSVVCEGAASHAAF